MLNNFAQSVLRFTARFHRSIGSQPSFLCRLRRLWEHIGRHESANPSGLGRQGPNTSQLKASAQSLLARSQEFAKNNRECTTPLPASLVPAPVGRADYLAATHGVHVQATEAVDHEQQALA